MKIGIVSDAHSETWGGSNTPLLGFCEQRLVGALDGADLILMAGDMGSGAASVEMARRLFPVTPVFMVPGNHEFDDGEYFATIAAMKQACHGSMVQVLHHDCAVLYSTDVPVRIIGATLWTDFDLHGNQPQAMVDAGCGMPDYHRISIAHDYDAPRTLIPQDTLDLHRMERAYLETQLARPFDGRTILMTHHPFLPFGLNPVHDGGKCSPAFASRLEGLLPAQGVDLAVWGHTHYPVDTMRGETRIISEPIGYLEMRLARRPDRYVVITECGGRFGRVIEL